MKVKFMIVLSFLILISGNLLSQDWNKISKEIRKKQLNYLPLTYVSCHYNLRQKSKCFQQLHVENNDTILLLEDSNDYSEPTITLTLWNRSDTLTFTSDDCYYRTQDGGKYSTKHNKSGFSKYMMKLVSEWNLEEIKKEDEKNGGSLPQYWVSATRIILKGNEYKIDCIFFRNFFDLNRDGMDF